MVIETVSKSLRNWRNTSRLLCAVTDCFSHKYSLKKADDLYSCDFPLVPHFPPSCSLFQHISGIFIFICVLRVHILLSFDYFLSVFPFVFAVCSVCSFRFV